MKPISETICLATSCSWDDLITSGKSILFRCTSVEERSSFSSETTARKLTTFNLSDKSVDTDIMHFQSEGEELTVWMRSNESKQKFRQRLHGSKVIIDITGFSHSQWAWLIEAALASKASSVKALYVEPGSYTFSDSPLGGEFFDLSEKTIGISPLPGFASINPRNKEFAFVPLLGFEGTRLNYILEQVQPNQNRTYPIIGVPGFQLEFPFYTIQGNKRVLMKESSIWANRRYARANCPNSVYTLLQEIHHEHRDMTLKIAPIGTKPHALGALLYKINFPKAVDIVYDHPVRKANRTSGTSAVLVYNLDLYRNIIDD